MYVRTEKGNDRTWGKSQAVFTYLGKKKFPMERSQPKFCTGDDVDDVPDVIMFTTFRSKIWGLLLIRTLIATGAAGSAHQFL